MEATTEPKKSFGRMRVSVEMDGVGFALSEDDYLKMIREGLTRPDETNVRILRVDGPGGSLDFETKTCAGCGSKWVPTPTDQMVDRIVMGTTSEKPVIEHLHARCFERIKKIVDAAVEHDRKVRK